MRRPNVEFVGTFLPVFSGPGAMIVNEVSGGSVDSLGIDLSFGLAVMATIYSVGDFSGIRINPAVHPSLRCNPTLPVVAGAALLGLPAPRGVRGECKPGHSRRYTCPTRG